MQPAMASAAIPSGVIDPATMTHRSRVLLFAIMAFGQFLALLDTQIVAASLNSVQAGLSAGPDEIAWVQTSYLMAEIVMIPLSGFLARALSTRWLFAGSAALFTLSSLLCGTATSINEMIAYRAIQGFVGGAMIPTVFAVGFTIFPPDKRAFIPGVLGLVSTLAPTLGPSLGGWITDAASWRWLFFMNIAPGLLITIAVPILGRIDAPDLSLLKRIDWLHLAGLTFWLAGLQYVLEEGPRHDWLQDEAVASAAWLSLVGGVVFFERCFRSDYPLVRLTPFRRPTFGIACGLNLVIGFGLYASTYLMPVFLGQVRDFSSSQIGGTIFVAGLAMGCGAPIAARLSSRADPRIVVGVGFALFALGLWLLSGMGPEWGFWELFIPQVVRGFAILLCIVPTVGLGIGGAAPADLRDASGLFNLTRNLGGAVGIALVNTWLQDQARVHSLRLSEAMGAAPDAAREVLAGLAASIGGRTTDAAEALAMAQGEIGRMVARQALTLAFDDVFARMALLFVLAIPLALLCKRPPVAAAPVSEH
ncbi:MAG: MFS transporter [Alphaproteobacteria bacterium]|nr:MAG: MFS transporter [Alphaproteobacteria bacterium]